jgi:hypothetical protein
VCGEAVQIEIRTYAKDGISELKSAVVDVQLMQRDWEAIPTQEDQCSSSSRLETQEQRLCVAIKILGMTLLGLGIGCSFIFIKWVFGIDA